MPFLGSSPARGLVGSADIDDNAITLAKMAAQLKAVKDKHPK